jgi:type II secretory pathway component PulC
LIPSYKAGKQVGFKIVTTQSPFDQFQLKKGDLITQVNSTSFNHKKALVSILKTLMTQKKGTFVLTVLRDQQKHQLTLELIE